MDLGRQTRTTGRERILRHLRKLAENNLFSLLSKVLAVSRIRVNAVGSLPGDSVEGDTCLASSSQG